MKKFLSAILTVALVFTGITFSKTHEVKGNTLVYRVETNNTRGQYDPDLEKYQRLSDSNVWSSNGFTAKIVLLGGKEPYTFTNYDKNLINIKKTSDNHYDLVTSGYGMDTISVRDSQGLTTTVPFFSCKRAKISFGANPGDGKNYVLATGTGNHSSEITYNFHQGATENNAIVGREWTSSNPTVCTVNDVNSATTTITAKKTGTAVITCRVYDKVACYNKYHYKDDYVGVTASVTVTVVNDTIVKIKDSSRGDIEKKTLNLKEDDELNLTPSLTNSVVPIKWYITSSNNEVAGIQGTKVNVKSGGNAKITVTGGGQTSYFDIKATGYIHTIETEKDVLLYEGVAKKLNYSYSPTTNIDISELKFRSSNPSVATIDDKGLMVAVSPGTCTFTISSKKVIKTINCTVASYLKSINLDKLSKVEIGSSYDISKILTKIPSSAVLESVKVKSSNTGVIEVYENNKIKCMRPGYARLTIEVKDSSGLTKTIDKEILVRLQKPEITSYKYSKKKNTIAWTLVPQATNYTVYRKIGKNKFKKLKTLTGTTYTEKKIKKGKAYYYKVVANHTNEKFNSEDSNTILLKSSLKKPKIKKIKKKKGIYIITIKGTKYTGFEIYYGTNKKALKKLGSAKKNIVGTMALKKGKKYFFKVRSYEVVGKKKVRSKFSKVYKYKAK